MNNSKSSIIISQIIEKIELIAGGGWAVFFGLCAIVAMFDGEKDGAEVIIIIWVLAALGVWAFLIGRKRKKMRLEFKKYVAQLSINPTGSLENFASAMGTSVDTVKKNLQFMIKKGFFAYAYIDEQNNQLVIPSITHRIQQPNQVDQGYASNAINASQPFMITCNCPNCGGANKIAKGMVAECDFCGSPIKG